MLCLRILLDMLYYLRVLVEAMLSFVSDPLTLLHYCTHQEYTMANNAVNSSH